MIHLNLMKKSTNNKIIKKLGHCPLASLQSLDDKRLPSRVTCEIYTLYSDIEWKEYIGIEQNLVN